MDRLHARFSPTSREDGEAGSEVIPGLAEALPEVTNGGKTYKLTLRKGLKYSDGTPVKASDFEHTIKRVLNLESGGAPYYEVIVGADKYLSERRRRGRHLRHRDQRQDRRDHDQADPARKAPSLRR